MTDDWNSDGLNDNWDEAHEFGIDLDGGGVATGGEDGAVADGFDLGGLAVFDAADLLGAELVHGTVDGAPGWLGGEVGAGVALPAGETLVTMLAELGDAGLDPESLRAFVAGISVRNPFLRNDG